jgi:uncharacterized membrane protein YqjE
LKIFDFNKLADTVSAYVETKIELLKLDLKEQLVQVLARLLTWSVLIFSMLTALLFLSIALSAFLNEILESSFWGYVIVAGTYILIGIGAFLSKESIERVLHSQVEKSGILQEKTDDEDEQ